MSEPPQQDLQVVLDNDKRGLLTVEEGRVDVLQLSQDGRRELPLAAASGRTRRITSPIAWQYHDHGELHLVDRMTLSMAQKVESTH
jgi:sphingosine kinase